jgi:hypothetical protein
MNSDNEQNSEILYQQLLYWLQHPRPHSTATDETAAEGSPNPPHQGPAPNSVHNVEPMIEWQPPEFSETVSDLDAQLEDPLDWELEELDCDRDLGESASAQSIQSFDVGELPIVQKRFQALLKRKLQAEIERHPPLFPWETAMADERLEYADEVASAPRPSRQVWIPHLAGVLPIALPEVLLSQLLDACTELALSLRPPSAQLMAAVKPLFPEHLSLLGGVVERIRLSPNLAPSRLSTTEREQQRQTLASALPSSYTAGTPEQQMAITLLAAREILEALTLVVSPQQESVERQWRTAAGCVWLRLHYSNSRAGQREPLKISARLPKGGRLSVQTDRETANAERTYPGFLSLELFDWQPGERYPIEVSLHDRQHKPLKFMAMCQ